MKREFSEDHKKKLKEAATKRWAKRKAAQNQGAAPTPTSKPSILGRIKRFFRL